MKFRKKPVVIDAVQFDGSNLSLELVELLHGKTWRVDKEGFLLIQTLEGVMEASPGDWIIKGVQGECYPCKPNIFDATYEAVEGK